MTLEPRRTLRCAGLAGFNKWKINRPGPLIAAVRAIEKMPSPNTLNVGDRVRFISLPDEWNEPGCGIHPDSISFMKRMLKRATPVRVTMIDEFGTPWIDAVTIERGKRHYHSWAITEESGWRKIVPRKR